MEKLKIGALNCQGIKGKIDDPEFIKSIMTEDIFGVSETWLHENDKIAIPGFKFYPINRKKEKGATRGGIGLFIKEELKKFIKVRYDLSNENILWCKLDKNHFEYDDDLYIGMIYIPPEYSTREKRLNIDHFKHLIETVTKIDSNNIILMGDFNARTKDFEDTLNTEKHDDRTPQNFYSEIKQKRSNQDSYEINMEES